MKRDYMDEPAGSNGCPSVLPPAKRRENHSERLRHGRGAAAGCAAWQCRPAGGGGGAARPATHTDVLATRGHRPRRPELPELHAASTASQNHHGALLLRVRSSVLPGVTRILIFGIVAFPVVLLVLDWALTPAGAHPAARTELLKQAGPQRPVQPLLPVPRLDDGIGTVEDLHFEVSVDSNREEQAHQEHLHRHKTQQNERYRLVVTGVVELEHVNGLLVRHECHQERPRPGAESPYL
mmetsp:Transcript_36008/g.94062  ORF Transcript_36008/g.94062 Transcript_36008/m.94062 type:complete len:238 (-) Transcript_36008:439-1152(-)